jgi:hypothetical protein
MVILEPGLSICFAGDMSPTAFIELKSIGLPEDHTKPLSATLCDLLNDALGIPPERIYIDFASPPRHLFGFNRSTF